MKKLLVILLTFVCLFSLSVLVACSPLDTDQSENNATDNTEPDDGAGNQSEDLPQITGVTFDGLTVDYDGTPKTLSVSSTILLQNSLLVMSPFIKWQTPPRDSI